MVDRLKLKLPPRRRWLDYPCAAISGVCLWAAFPDVGWWPLFVIGLAFLVALVGRSSTGRGMWYATLVGALFWLPHIHWSSIATGGWLPWVTLSATQIIALCIWAWCAAISRALVWVRTWWGQTLSWAVLWVAVEQLRSTVPFGGFPWGKTAYAMVDAPWGKLAPWGGEVLVSAVTMMLAVLLRRTFSLLRTRSDEHWWNRPLMLVLAAALACLPLAITLPNAQEAGSIRVGVVQGNVEIPGNATYSVPLKVTGNHTRETLRMAEEGDAVDVAVWGETAADRDPRANSGVANLVDEAVDALGVPILVGFNGYDSQDNTRTNLVGWWYPDSGLSDQLYGKQHPVPFGEYIPWRSFISKLATEAAQVNVDMVAVDNPSLLSVTLNDGREVPFVMGICFEVAYEDLIRDGVERGGQIIAIPTNNYHFRYSAESAQQAQMLRFRAMEYGRSGIQASTNGVSMIVRPDGTIVRQTAKQTADHMVAQLPLRTSLTWAARLGIIPSVGIMCGGGVVTICAVVRALISVRRR